MRGIRLTLITVAALLAVPVAALAADAGGKSPDMFEPRVDLAIWSVVVFLGLFFILRKYAWGPILEGLQKRETAIHGAISEAERTRVEAKKLQEQLTAQMAAANDKAREIAEEARRDALRQTEEMIRKAKADIQADRDRLHREIDTARDQTTQALMNGTVTISSLIASKALGRQVTVDDHKRLLNEALAELRQAGEQRQKELGSFLA